MTAAKLWALDAPHLTIPAANLVNGADGQVTIPVPAYLVQHERGLVLFDTSITPMASEDPVGVFGDAADHLQVDYPPEKKLPNQLESLGFKPADVTHVVTSHSHFDHVGGLEFFPQARHYIGAEEIRWAFWPDPPGQAYFSGAAFESLRDAHWTHLPVGVDHDIFGDGTITTLSLPGHTIGSTGLLVRLPSQNVILTGDALHLRRSLEHEEYGPVDYSSRLALETIRRIARLRESENATMLISHDPDDSNEYGHAPRFLS